MKELSTEEKAQRYDEALKAAKRNYEAIVEMDDDCTFAKEGIVNTFHHIFPVLKESEDDRMRKWIVDELKSSLHDIEALYSGDYDNRDKDDIIREDYLRKAIAWLERHGVQKPEMIFLKFRIGDKVTNGKDTYTIDSIGKDCYWVKEHDCITILFEYQHHWELVEQKFTMIQWQGNNLKEVIDFTGKDKNFEKWFKSFEEYEQYVHMHNDIFKIFNEDGSHYEIPVGAWIIKTPDGYNVPSKAKYIRESVDMVEPKFKVGDWITNGQLTCKVLSVISKSYELHLYNDDYCHFETDVQSIDKDYHLWTIGDAKDGDVLHSTGWHDDCIFIFNGLDNWRFDEPNGDRVVATGYCCLSVSADKMELGIQGPDCVETNTIKPATKIQRDLLFQKMHEAGYEWDTEKKELKKIEQKPVDKVVQFKVGDWVVFGNKHQSIYQVEKIEEWRYILRHTHGGTLRVCVLHDESLRLWTIEDAKEGDVLVDGNLPFIFKKIDTNKYSYAYCGISADGDFKIESDGEHGEWTWLQDIKPATKEQRDLLFQKMHEAGYEWDAAKKELKKIDQTPTWSEEDDSILQGIWDEILANKRDAKEYDWKTYDKFLNWLESLKERVQSQPKQEWKPSDRELGAILAAIGDERQKCSDAAKDLLNIYQQLKKLKEE